MSPIKIEREGWRTHYHRRICYFFVFLSAVCRLLLLCFFCYFAPDKTNIYINGIIYGWAVLKFIKLNSIFYLFVCICLAEPALLRLLLWVPVWPVCMYAHDMLPLPPKKRIICRLLVNRKLSLNCFLIYFKIMFILLTAAVWIVSRYVFAIWYCAYTFCAVIHKMNKNSVDDKFMVPTR